MSSPPLDSTLISEHTGGRGHLSAKPAGLEALFSDDRSPTRRLHISWHGAERIIVLSIWHENRCTASFRMPVQGRGKDDRRYCGRDDSGDQPAKQ